MTMLRSRSVPPVISAVVLGALAMWLGATGATSAQENRAGGKPKLVLDCDTANEIDDLYAIVRMLRQDKFEVLALNSAQWFHYETTLRSVYASQRLNEELVRLLGRADLPTPVGSEQPMGKPWGGDQPKDSPAARFIIEAALKMPQGEKLCVVCTGASTNLASAVKLKPEIAPRIKAYVLGFSYDHQRGVWSKSEFNVRRDLNAANFLLDCEGLELHVMPASTAGALKFEQNDSFRRQARMGSLGAYLTARWLSRVAEAKTWIMWDVALIEALIHPELAAEKKVTTPPENKQREVWMYHRIDSDAMRADFWRARK